MSRRFLSLVLLGMLCAAAARAELKFATLAAGDTVYKDVIIIDVTANDILFRHSTGMSNIKLRYLSPELQKRFHYDPFHAENIERQQDAATLRYQKVASQSLWDRFFAQKAAQAQAETNEVFRLADPVGENSLLNKPAPALALPEWYSEKPEPYAGKFTLVLFWNSQSEPCRRAIADMNNLQAKFTNDLAVIGVTTETAAQVRLMTAPEIQFSHGGDTKSKLLQAAGITSVPSVLLTDRAGIVRYQGHPAAVTEAALQMLMAK